MNLPTRTLQPKYIQTTEAVTKQTNKATQKHKQQHEQLGFLPVLASWDWAVVDQQRARRGLWHHSGLWDGGAEVQCGRVAAVAVGWADDGSGGVDVVAVDSAGQSASGTPPRLSPKGNKQTNECRKG